MFFFFQWRNWDQVTEKGDLKSQNTKRAFLLGCEYSLWHSQYITTATAQVGFVSLHIFLTYYNSSPKITTFVHISSLNSAYLIIFCSSESSIG